MDNSMLNNLGFDPAYVLIGMAAVILILLILVIVCLVKLGSMRQKYAVFMKGENARSLEKTLIKRLEEVERLAESDSINRRNIERLFKQHRLAIQKTGMVKYDAFDEMGGKLSFALALLDQNNTGIVLNVVHTREGCYTYIKEIIENNSVLVLTEEEKQAMEVANQTQTTAE